MEYATLEQLKAFLKIAADDDSRDDELTLLITNATAVVDSEIGGNLEESEVTARFDGSGSERLTFPHVVNSVTSAVEVSTGYEFEVSYLEGKIAYFSEDIPKGRKNLEVSYSKGFEAVPADMNYFFLHYCRELLNQQESGDTETVKTQSLGGGLSLTYFSPSELSGRVADVSDVLSRYREFRIS